MNTFGIKRKIHTFGLKRPALAAAYHEVQRFILAMAKRINIAVGR